MADLPVITRPNGKPYRPRKISGRGLTDEDGCLTGVVILGIHDIDRAQPLALKYVQWQLDAGYAPARPTLVWWREAIERGDIRWYDDAEHGRAGVWFQDIVEVPAGVR